MKMTWWFHDIF